MEVCKKKLYHLHCNNEYDDMWVAGNIIDNTDSEFLNEFTLLEYTNEYYAELDGERVCFNEILNYFIENKPRKKTTMKLLKDAREIINDFLLTQRERALEEVRLKYYPHLVSRRQAIWACDDLGLEWWSDVFEGRSIYEIEVTGNMFVTSEEYLPYLGMSYVESLEMAHEYWNPNLDDVSIENIEYLIQGKIKVLKKV